MDMGLASDVDVILGVQWESPLGSVTSNFATGEMSFEHQGARGGKQRVTLSSILHAEGVAGRHIDAKTALRYVRQNSRASGHTRPHLFVLQANDGPGTRGIQPMDKAEHALYERIRASLPSSQVGSPNCSWRGTQ